MKKFKSSKRRKNVLKIKKILFVFFFFFMYFFAYNYSKNNKYNKNLLNEKINYINLDLKKIIIQKVTNSVSKPVLLLNNNIKKIKNKSIINTKITTKKTGNLKNVYNQDSYKPIIYLYNTHQSESYIDYSVYDATLKLSNKLTKSGITTYFEEQSITTFLQDNNLKYYKSYTVSRKYLTEQKEKYSSLNYFFDIHRDSVSKSKSTITFNNKTYAKVLFIVGLDNPNHDKNYDNALKLNNIINSKVNGISRGIMQKGGKGVNGVYNQDISSNVFLIEVGSSSNTKNEVNLTMNIIYESISEYVRGTL